VRPTLLLLVAALACPSAAAAHITIRPPFVEAGVETQIGLSVPGERPPHATITVEASLPGGFTIESASSPDGWTASVDGSTVTWSGGRITGRTETRFPVRIRASVRAGTYRIATRQAYDDGEDVLWASDLSVLPATGEAAPDQHPWPAIVAAFAGMAIILGSLLVLLKLRR
jgi:hypothetical protein